MTGCTARLPGALEPALGDAARELARKYTPRPTTTTVTAIARTFRRLFGLGCGRRIFLTCCFSSLMNYPWVSHQAQDLPPRTGDTTKRFVAHRRVHATRGSPTVKTLSPLMLRYRQRKRPVANRTSRLRSQGSRRRQTTGFCLSLGQSGVGRRYRTGRHTSPKARCRRSSTRHCYPALRDCPVALLASWRRRSGWKAGPSCSQSPMMGTR